MYLDLGNERLKAIYRLELLCTVTVLESSKALEAYVRILEIKSENGCEELDILFTSTKASEKFLPRACLSLLYSLLN